MIHLYFGPVINPQTLTSFLALPRCLIAVGSDGNIIWIEEDIDPSFIQETIRSHSLKDGDYTIVDSSEKPGEFIMPGLVDTHVHAYQFPLLGIGGELELGDWLCKYALPMQEKFENAVYAERAYVNAVKRSIACGTTTACYFGTVHLEATVVLADVVHKKGQRALIGKMCSQDTDFSGSIRDTIRLIQHIQHLPPSRDKEPLVYPTICADFMMAPDEQLPTALGKLVASMPHVPIQIHISENRKNIKETLERFGAESYATLYDKFGLLRNNTILGHGVWLTEKEKVLIAQRGSGVAHCPTSNFYLSSGMAQAGSLLDHSIKVGLGTDVSGGYNPSILYAIQMASATSKMIFIRSQLDEECCKHEEQSCSGPSNSESVQDAIRHPGYDSQGNHGDHRPHRHQHRRNPSDQFTARKLGVETLLYIATLGGASVCNLQNRVGSFAPGKSFDALHVSIDDACGNPAVWGAGVDESERVMNEANLRRWLERFLFGGDDRNVKQVFVQGVVVGGAEAGMETCVRQKPTSKASLA